MAALLPAPTFGALLSPGDPFLQVVLDLLPDADLYLQEEVYIALPPTLSRVCCRRGRRGQRHVQAPGQNAKTCGCGLVDGRAGCCDWASADNRAAEPLCPQLRRAVARSQARGRVAIVLLDNLGIPTLRPSRKLRALLEEDKDDLLLVYTPTYDPHAKRSEWLWRALRAAVPHNHQRQTREELLADARVWADALTPTEVLTPIGSPFADEITPPEELQHAACFSGKHLVLPARRSDYGRGARRSPRRFVGEALP
jgi:transposase